MATNVYWKSIEVIDDGILMDVGQAISEYVKNYNMSPNGGKQRQNDHTGMSTERRSSPRLRSLRANVGSSSSVAIRTRNRRRRGRSTGPPETLFKYPFPPKKMKVTITVSTTYHKRHFFFLKLTHLNHPPLPPQDHDFDRCESDFLNDNLIDFSLMREVTERFNCPDTELYIFSSFFLQTLHSGEE